MSQEHFERTIEKNKVIFEQLGVKENDGLWIFGYGSLLYKVNFTYTEKRVGFIHGYVRRLWQESRDHRGTPEKPGRVATLIPVNDQKQIVWGILYYIPPSYLQDAMEILNFREKDGYTLKTVKCYERETLKERNVILYIANVKNEETIEQTAHIVANTVGPSGANREYLFKMAEALRQNNILTDDDKDHALNLEKKVKEILGHNKYII